MSEYVVNVGNADEEHFKLLGEYATHFFGHPVGEKVVRCKDCKYFNDYHDKCHRTATIIDVDGNVYLTDEENGFISMTDAGPDGFCAWGEMGRKEGRVSYVSDALIDSLKRENDRLHTENDGLRESIHRLLTQRDERLATAETESAKLRELFRDFWEWADPPFALRSGTFDEFLAIVDRMRESGIEVQK